MQNDARPGIWTRRSVLLWVPILAGGGLGWAASGEFWDKKEPADWSPEEVDRLLKKSPWAKEVSATGVPSQAGYGGNGGQNPNGGGYPGGGYPGGGYPGGGMGYPRYPGMGYPRRGSGYPGGGRRGETRQGTVRWESAKPILEAEKNKLPDAFQNHYVIGVSGFPLTNPNSEDNGTSRQIDELKLNTTLQPKGKEIAQPGVAQPNGPGTAWLFGFSRDAIALTKDDKEVDFATKISGFTVKTKFNLKEMMYKGDLAV